MRSWVSAFVALAVVQGAGPQWVLQSSGVTVTFRGVSAASGTNIAYIGNDIWKDGDGGVFHRSGA
jgi:hypothetical protein